MCCDELTIVDVFQELTQKTVVKPGNGKLSAKKTKYKSTQKAHNEKLIYFHILALNLSQLLLSILIKKNKAFHGGGRV